MTLPISFKHGFATPMGVIINLNLNTNWMSDINLKLKFKNYLLNFSSNFKTLITVMGELSSGALIAEVGGSVQGTFLDATFDTALNLQLTKLVIILSYSNCSTSLMLL